MAQNINKDAVYRAAKPKDKDYTINDGGGLYLLVKSIGSKLWQLVYTMEGKRKKLALGIYPNVTLVAARREAETARKKITEGIDPGAIKRQEKEVKKLTKQNQQRQKEGLPILNSFADIARQWLNSIEHLAKSTTHAKKTSRLERA